ncbi:MAG: HYR domain-containing protein [Phycisphaerae bacterium]|nr:HYR domain-containing protein [Saprospiraceae bacterium]
MSCQFLLIVAAFIALPVTRSNAQTCTYDYKITASQNPFAGCPSNVGTIIIKDTFLVNMKNFTVDPGNAGTPFNGNLIVDGGVIIWSGTETNLIMGEMGRILLYNDGYIYPRNLADANCNQLKTISFGPFKIVSCKLQDTIYHSFADVNLAGCVDGGGICCDVALTVKENSGNPNDLTLCEPGDSVELSMQGSGSLNYFSYIWNPNIGNYKGPYKVAQNVNTTYSIGIQAQFDPEGPQPAYILGCGASSTVKINPQINLITTVTPVPCASSAVGAINLTPTGGTSPYKYLWSNTKTTEDLTGLVGGTYTVTVTDKRGCSEVKSVVVFTLDNIPPALTCPGSGNGIASPNQCTTTISGINATFSDNCPAPALSYVITGATTATGSGQLSNTLPFQVGLSNVKYQVSDGSNTVSCFFTVTVLDNQYPAAPNPATIKGIQCFADIPTPDPTVVIDETDNCGTPTVTYLSQSVVGGSWCPGDPRVFSRKYRVVDASGNGISVTQLIEVADTQAPTFSQVPANTTANCHAVPAVGNVTATDNCTPTVLITYLGETRTNGACPNAYTLTRTWSAQDDCGNSATTAQLISVQDVTKPVFSSVPANVTVNCQSVPAVGTASATDNCDASATITYLGETRTNGACLGYYALRRTWKATDDCGNTATAEQVITVQDITSPSFTTVPANVTVSCESVPIPGNPAATDNCAPSASITYLGETRSNGTCPDTYTLTRIWKASDECGNTSTASQLITVRDITAPSFTSIPGNVTVSCDAIPPAGTPVASDNCDNAVTIVYNGETRTNGACPNNYTLKRQWTATDNCSNTQTGVQTITVQDLAKPVFSFVPPNVTVSCEALPAVGTPTASDNCGTTVINYLGETRVDGTCLNTYLLRRQWRATDQCNNSATAEQVITVQDLAPPVYTFVPDAVTVNCDVIPAVGTPTSTDNCDASVSIVYSGETRVNGSCPNNYLLNRNWIATDNCGNTSVATQVITVRDITPPAFTSVPAAATSSCESLPIVGIPLASDNCTQIVLISYLGESVPGNGGACPGNYAIVRTWSAQDACGNTASATQTITVQDITPPIVISVPADVVVSCANIPAVGTPTATDNCDATPTITYTGATQINGPCPNSYTIKRKWTISDDCGNSSTAIQTLTVQDVTAPVFTSSPAAITVSCESIPAVGSPVATDDCAANVNITYNGQTRQDGLCPDSYTLTRKWTAKDACGNATTTSQIITVQDVTLPVFGTVPAGVTVDCDAIPAVGTPAATDNCDASVSIVYDGETRVDGSCPNNYLLNRKWTATDNCGNTIVATQVITVRDIKAPTFTSVPAATTASCESLPVVGTPLASDNCTTNVTISYLGQSTQGSGGACPGNYAIVRTWSAEDACGNTATATQAITVQDLIPPVVISVPADEVVSCANIPTVGAPTAIDNCDATPTITYIGATQISGPCPNSYTIKRRWVISDDCGNNSPAIQTLTVQDVTAPVFTSIPAAVTVSCESIPTVGTPVATDDCAANVNITYNGVARQDGLCPDYYTLTRKWTVSDACGNTATATQIITVQDVTPPAFSTIPAPITVSCDALPAVGTPTATDNCDAAVSIQYNGQLRIDGSCPNSYSLQRSWVATDNCGNTSLATQLITVQDIKPPVFTSVPVPITVSCEAIPNVGTPAATDNCSANISISYQGETRTDGACSGYYTLTRTWSAQDACSNVTTATQKITVQDNTKPVVTSVPANVTVSCSAIPAVGTPTATDNCDADLSIIYNGATRINGGCPNSYTLKRQWTITDDCGNSNTTVQTLTVQDITPPSFTTVPAAITVSCEAIPPVQSPTAVDDCASSVSITYTGEVRTNGTCPDSYTLKRSWMARDSCGNTSTATQVITVQDITAPNFTLVPSDVVVNCDAIPLVAFPTAVDNCDAFVNVTYSGQVRIDGNCPQTYFLRREWIATDNCSNTSKTTQVITVQDITAPQFVFVPANATVSCESVPPAGNPTATDNCDADVSITYLGETRTDGNCPSNYTLKRTWSAKDDCGNTKTALQILTVHDIVRPVFTFVPLDSTVNCNAVPVPGTPIATDNCTAVPNIVFLGQNIVNSPSPDSYTLQRSWSATDECNNTSTALQVLTVQDTISPTIQCPGSMTMDANPATCTGVATFNAPVTSDNCSTALTVSSTANSGQAFPIGVTPVTMTVSDPTGNLSTCTFNITVLDKTAPVLVNCPTDFTVTADLTSCNAVVNWVAPTVTDPCDLSPIVPSSNITTGSVLPTGIYPITYTAGEASGNSVQCSFTLTVRENVPPVLVNCPPNISVNTDSCDAMVNWTPPSTTDNCSTQVTLSVNMAPGSIFPETSTTVKYTATDNWGNSANCTFTVTVIDIVPPQFSGCPDSMLVNAGLCSVPVSWDQPTASDNCVPNPTVYSLPAPGTVFFAGFKTVNVFVVDPSGNRDTCTFVVEVIGPPIGLSNVPVNQSFTGCSAVATWNTPMPTGLCNNQYTLSSNYPSGYTFGIGSTEVIYTLQDTLGHIVTSSFTVKVTESIPPQFSCPVSPIKVNTSGAILNNSAGFVTATDTISTCDGVELQFPFPSATDNCGTPEVTQVTGQATASTFDVGSHTLTFQAKDDAGNTALCSVQIQVLQLLPLNPLISDVIGCKGDEITLSATPISGAQYSWTGPNPPYPDNNNIVIMNVDSTLTGYYTVVANVNGCVTPLDSALVRIGKLPHTVDDLLYQVATHEILPDFNILLNDTYEQDDYTLTINNPSPSLINHGNGLYSYQAGNVNTTVYFIYRLCSKACPNLCDEGIIGISVRERICTYIPNIITPNGDDVNDYLTIPCLDIEPYPLNHLAIYNQWGDKIYEAEPYVNDPDKAWRGELFGEHGKGLPDAPYFYIFKATPEDKGLKGFIEVFR